MFIVKSSVLKCSLEFGKCYFYCAANTVFGKINRIEEVLLHIVKYKRLPVLLYSFEECPMKISGLCSLDFVITGFLWSSLKPILLTLLKFVRVRWFWATWCYDWKTKITFLSRLDTLACSFVEISEVLVFSFYYSLPCVANKDFHITIVKHCQREFDFNIPSDILAITEKIEARHRLCDSVF